MGFIMHKDAVVACQHAPGLAEAKAPDPRVSVSGKPVMTVLRLYSVTGCALNGTNSPPCTTAMWIEGAQRVTVGGFPVAIDSGKSKCIPSLGKLEPRIFQQRVEAQ
ncbi:MAG TPA: hypothetical protein VFU13_20205 [Steroidobacteraceae bacterium]|nr:hypothetical protein [Steroidobacteraceae bacterium]